MVDVWPNAIELLIAVGDLDRARAYLGQYERGFGSNGAEMVVKR